jgi:hypothetical protein
MRRGALEKNYDRLDEVLAATKIELELVCAPGPVEARAAGSDEDFPRPPSAVWWAADHSGEYRI